MTLCEPRESTLDVNRIIVPTLNNIGEQTLLKYPLRAYIICSTSHVYRFPADNHTSALRTRLPCLHKHELQKEHRPGR